MQTIYVITTKCLYDGKTIEYDHGFHIADNTEAALLKIVSLSDDLRLKLKDEWTFSESVLSEDRTVVEVFLQHLGRFYNGSRILAFRVSYTKGSWVEAVEDLSKPVIMDELSMSLHLNPKCDACNKFHDASFACGEDGTVAETVSATEGVLATEVVLTEVVLTEVVSTSEDVKCDELEKGLLDASEYKGGEPYVPETNADVEVVVEATPTNIPSKEDLEDELKKSSKTPRSFSWFG